MFLKKQEAEHLLSHQILLPSPQEIHLCPLFINSNLDSQKLTFKLKQQNVEELMKPSIKEMSLPFDILAQVNEVRDISLPLRKEQEQQEETDELEETQMTQLKFAGQSHNQDKKKDQGYKPNKPKRRTLFFSLTDGSTQFNALEDRLVPQIKPQQFKVGSKVVFKQGATVKRGRIILSAAHFAIIGHPLNDLLKEEKKEESKVKQSQYEPQQLQFQDMPPDLFEDQSPAPFKKKPDFMMSGYQRREQWEYGRVESRESLDEYFENVLFLERD